MGEEYDVMVRFSGERYVPVVAEDREEALVKASKILRDSNEDIFTEHIQGARLVQEDEENAC